MCSHLLALRSAVMLGALRIINGNAASSNGGGISSEGDSLTLTNFTVSGNNAVFDGGGILNFGASSRMTLTNSTVSDNTAGGNGAMVNNGGTAILRNTIVAGNTTFTGLDALGSYSSEGNNLIGNTSGAVGFGDSDIVGRNPLLGPLQDNGGSTDTHALLSRSPAIDKGTNAGCPSTDQRGKARPMDGDGKGQPVLGGSEFEVDTTLTPPGTQCGAIHVSRRSDVRYNHFGATVLLLPAYRPAGRTTRCL
jgi:hypothetical protein